MKLVDRANEEPVKTTKRMILSQVARIFDPVNFSAALVIRSKIGLLQVRHLRLDGDDEVPLTIHDNWISMF